MWRLTTGAYESVELIRYVDHMWSHQFTWRVYQLFYGNALNCGDSRVSAFVVQAHSSIYSAFLVDWTESEYRQPTVRRSIATSVETGSELLYNLLSPVYQTQKDAAVQLIGYIQKPVLIEPNSSQGCNIISIWGICEGSMRSIRLCSVLWFLLRKLAFSLYTTIITSMKRKKKSLTASISLIYSSSFTVKY